MRFPNLCKCHLKDVTLSEAKGLAAVRRDSSVAIASSHRPGVLRENDILKTGQPLFVDCMNDKGHAFVLFWLLPLVSTTGIFRLR